MSSESRKECLLTWPSAFPSYNHLSSLPFPSKIPTASLSPCRRHQEGQKRRFELPSPSSIRWSGLTLPWSPPWSARCHWVTSDERRSHDKFTEYKSHFWSCIRWWQRWWYCIWSCIGSCIFLPHSHKRALNHQMQTYITPNTCVSSSSGPHCTFTYYQCLTHGCLSESLARVTFTVRRVLTNWRDSVARLTGSSKWKVTLCLFASLHRAQTHFARVSGAKEKQEQARTWLTTHFASRVTWHPRYIYTVYFGHSVSSFIRTHTHTHMWELFFSPTPKSLAHTHTHTTTQTHILTHIYRHTPLEWTH